MNEKTEANNNKPQDAARAWWHDLRSAGMLWLVLGAAVTVTAYGWYVGSNGVEIAAQIDKGAVEKLGAVGDTFGVLTSFFNSLAFAALVATIVLQTRELRETRQHIERQATAQEKQAEQARELAEIQFRPFIKAEWLPDKTNAKRIAFRLRNVGMGIAIIKSIELRARGESFGSVAGHFDRNYKETARQWQSAANAAVKDAIGLGVELLQFNNLNRILAPGEAQAVALVVVPNDRSDIERLLTLYFEPIVQFDSTYGQAFTTVTQFEGLISPSAPGPVAKLRVGLV